MKVFAENRKAFHNFQILDKYTSGIELFGFEVKAIREGKADFEGSFIKIENGRPVLVNMNIGKFSKQGDLVTEAGPKRARNLLLQKYEIDRVASKSAQKGYALAPLKLYADHGLIKLEFALVKGKKTFDKKRELKQKQIDMDLKRGDARI